MRWREVLTQAWRFDEPRILSAQMSLLDRNLTAAFVASGGMALLTALALEHLAAARHAWVWAAVTVLLSGLCMTWRGALPRPDQASAAGTYAQSVRLMAALMGVAWGALGVWFIDPDQPLSLTLVLGISGGMNSGGLAVFSASWPVALAFWLCNMLPVLVALLVVHHDIGVVFALAVATYLGAIAVFGYHAAQAALHAIRLGMENEALVQRLRDQTQRALEARQLAETALAEAEEANRAKTVFLASASHDLRQPLHAMGLFLSALARANLNERQQQLLAQAQASALATGDMLATLMDFSKVDAGVIRPHMQAFALQPLFQKLEREMAPLAEDKGLAFRMRDTSQILHADPALVEMMLRNLLLNAIRYTDRGAVLLACRCRAGRAEVEVWDTGIGIPAQQHQAIFREFHQLGNPERDRRKGLGLGLAIVDGLARVMSVGVSLRSQPGRGSVFRLTLPISQQAWVEQDPVPQSEPDLRGLRVLLIEDDDAVRAAMADLLATWGCWCESAASGEDALTLLPRFEPDVVLTDYRLRHNRTGLQALQAVRERLGRALPAAIITGDTAAERLREAHASGLALLHKPVPADKLQKVLLSLWCQAVPAASASTAG